MTETTHSQTTAEWLDASVIAAVQRHMSDDHADDTLVIARSRETDAVSATIETLDLQTITLVAVMPDGTDRRIVIDWPTPLRERVDIRNQVVVLYEHAGGTPH